MTDRLINATYWNKMKEKSMEIIITPLQETDIPEFLVMNNDLNDVDCGTLDSMRESLRNNKNEFIYIAKHNDEAVGFICGQLYSSICYASKQGEMTELYVKKNYRRMGVATKLVKHMENELVKNKAHEITIITGQKNLTAQKLYEKCGYKYIPMLSEVYQWLDDAGFIIEKTYHNYSEESLSENETEFVRATVLAKKELKYLYKEEKG